MNKLSMWVFRCSSVSEILKYIRAITSHRAPIRYGVEKVEGKSYDRLRLSRKAESPLVYRYWLPCTELRERNNPARMRHAVFHLYHSWTRIRQSAIAGYFLQQPLSLYASALIVLCSSSSCSDAWCGIQLLSLQFLIVCATISAHPQITVCEPPMRWWPFCYKKILKNQCVHDTPFLIIVLIFILDITSWFSFVV